MPLTMPTRTGATLFFHLPVEVDGTMRVAWDLSPRDDRRAARLLDHLPIGANDDEGYRRWGTIVRPGALVADVALI